MSQPLIGFTCGACKHWHRHPVDPTNLAASLGNGECREHLRSVSFPGPKGWVICGGYVNVEAAFPACGRFALKVVDA